MHSSIFIIKQCNFYEKERRANYGSNYYSDYCTFGLYRDLVHINIEWNQAVTA